MALDRRGRPIPLYVPPLRPPPPTTPPPALEQHRPDLENEVALLRGEVDLLRAWVDEGFRMRAELDELRSRFNAWETPLE